MDAEDVAVILDDITNRLAPASQAAWDILVSQRTHEAFEGGRGESV